MLPSQRRDTNQNSDSCRRTCSRTTALARYLGMVSDVCLKKIVPFAFIKGIFYPRDQRVHPQSHFKGTSIQTGCASWRQIRGAVYHPILRQNIERPYKVVATTILKGLETKFYKQFAGMTAKGKSCKPLNRRLTTFTQGSGNA